MTKNFRRRVVAVGMFDSIHFARWLDQFKDEDIDFRLIPSSPNRQTHPRIKELLRQTGCTHANYSAPYGASALSLPIWLLDKFLSMGIRSRLIFREIKLFRPDFVHAIEFQNAGYVTRRAIEMLKVPRPFFILTNYGSDIFWFSRDKRHRREIMAALAVCDLYSAECQRDVTLANDLGFKGKVHPVSPNAGGFDDDILNAPIRRMDERNLIMVKGYHGWVGRAKLAFEAMDLIAEKLAGLEVVVYSCNRTTIRRARKFARETRIPVRIFPKKALSHRAILELFSRAKIYLGLSLSDGISTSLLEAMAMGAIPIQTSSACCEEWFSQSGVKIDDLRANVVASAILEALKLSEDPANQEKNLQTIRLKASAEKTKAEALSMYR